MLLAFVRYVGRSALRRKWRILDARAIAAWATPRERQVSPRYHLSRPPAPYQQQVIDMRRTFEAQEDAIREAYNRQLEDAQRAVPGYTEVMR